MAVTSIKNKTKSGSLLVGNAAYEPSQYYQIATVTVGAGGSSSIDFTSIPSTYKHLQIRYIGRSNTADTNDNVSMRFNSDTSANYDRHYVYAGGASISVGANINQTYIVISSLSAANAASSIFAGGIIDILDYTSTNKNKTVRALSGDDRNGSGDIQFYSGLWFKTPEAITSITLLANNGSSNFVQYSSFALYGVKG